MALALVAGGVRAEDEAVTVTFAFEAKLPHRTVCVAGEFNGWAPDAWPLTRGADGVWRREARLAPGVYRYKLVVDGEWLHDPTNPRRDPDGFRNSVLVVGDAPEPDLAPRAAPRPTKARAGAFHVVPAGELGAPPEGIAPRPLYVYTPPSYEREPERRYPALYAHDGQNVWSEEGICFGHGGWYLDETLDRLVAEGAIEEVILVGVPHGPDRLMEYGTRAELYGRFLLKNVLPAVDARFRTRTGPQHTALIGSSMGGLVSFTLLLTRGDAFGRAACLSSSFWFEDAAGRTAFDVLAGFVDSRRVGRPARDALPRLYLDSGTAGQGQDGAPDTRRMRDALLAAGWTADRDLQHHEAAGATHDERAWRARADRPLRWMFGRR